MPESAAHPVNVGVIGLGRSGWGIHVAYLAQAQQYRLAAVADPLEERRQEAIQNHGVRAAYEDPEELLKDEDVELVVVATPSHTHKDLAIAALEAGKHVLVEKPFAQSAAEADEMIAAAKANGRLLTCFQNRRFDADFLEVRRIIESGRLGRAFLVRIGTYRFERRRDWQTLTRLGGGMLNNWGAHRIDQALLLLGGAYDELFCDLQRTVSAGDAEDHVKVTLKRNDLVVDVEIFSASPIKPGPTWTVIGDRGMLVGEYSSLTVQWVEPDALPPIEADPGPVPGRRYGSDEVIPWQTEEVQPAGEMQNAAFYRRLFESIRHGEPLAVTPESVRLQLEVLDRCRATYTPA